MPDVHRVGPYVIGNTLGAGITGKVKLAFDKDTGEQVAVKIINRDIVITKPSMGPKLDREVAIMKLMDHPNVLHMYDYCETDDHMYLVLEYAQNGELFDFLVRKGALEAKKALKLFQQIIEGVDYAHNHFVCHRDLKPENILLDADNNIKIADFGMSGIKQEELLFHTSCGSPHYASPEVIAGIDYDGIKADIWSCGVILYALMTGRLPFDNENIRILLSKVKSGIFLMPSFLDADVKDLINKMLVVDPAKRISITEIRNHPWYLTRVPDTPPTPALKPSETIVTEEVVDNNIVQSLIAMGFGTRIEIIEYLASSEANFVKTFYQLYEARKNEPREIERQKRLSRAKSETGMRKRISRRNSVKPSGKTPEGGLKPSTHVVLSKKKKTLTRRISYTFNNTSFLSQDRRKSVAIEPQKKVKRNLHLSLGEDSAIEKKLTSPRKSWLPTWFGNGNDANLKKVKRKNLKEGLEIRKPISEILTLLESTLEDMGASYCFTAKRDRIKGRLSAGPKSVKFYITLYIIDEEAPTPAEGAEPGYWLIVTRRAGDKALYTNICTAVNHVAQ